MTDIIDQEIAVEGGFRHQPGDPGGRTKYGISEKSFPEAWADGDVSLDEARGIYQHKFYEAMGINTLPEPLQHQVLDFAINSGRIAIMKLQEILKVDADGFIGPATLAALAGMDLKQVGNALVDSRILMQCRLAQKRPVQLPDLFGWVTRSLAFRS